jgi:hypothetical protein
MSLWSYPLIWSSFSLWNIHKNSIPSLPWLFPLAQINLHLIFLVVLHYVNLQFCDSFSSAPKKRKWIEFQLKKIKIKEKKREERYQFCRQKRFELQFDWCQLCPSFHYFYLAPFLSTCSFSLISNLDSCFCLDYYSILHTYIQLVVHYKFTPPSSTQSIRELYTFDSVTIVLPLLLLPRFTLFQWNKELAQ